MSQTIANHDVLTLEETADFLRISIEEAEDLANRGAIPGRRIRESWRFLRRALEDWLQRPNYNQALLNQCGALRDDSSLEEMIGMIYAERGRPEAEPFPES